MRQVTGKAPVVRNRAVLKLRRSNLSLQLLVANKAQLGGRLAEQEAKLVVVRSVTLDTGQSFRHCAVLEIARCHVAFISLWQPSRHSSAGDRVSSDGRSESCDRWHRLQSSDAK